MHVERETNKKNGLLSHKILMCVYCSLLCATVWNIFYLLCGYCCCFRFFFLVFFFCLAIYFILLYFGCVFVCEWFSHSCIFILPRKVWCTRNIQNRDKKQKKKTHSTCVKICDFYGLKLNFEMALLLCYIQSMGWRFNYTKLISSCSCFHFGCVCALSSRGIHISNEGIHMNHPYPAIVIVDDFFVSHSVSPVNLRPTPLIILTYPPPPIASISHAHAHNSLSSSLILILWVFFILLFFVPFFHLFVSVSVFVGCLHLN